MLFLGQCEDSDYFWDSVEIQIIFGTVWKTHVIQLWRKKLHAGSEAADSICLDSTLLFTLLLTVLQLLSF